MKFGLIGFPLSHSFSKKYFTDKFESLGLADFTYENYPLSNIEEILPLLQDDISGLNVTIPYKSLVIPFLDDVDPEASQIGAVNTLVRTSPDKWKGFNTDINGFKLSLLDWMKNESLPERALILGNGGVAKAIRQALLSLGIPSSMVSRSGNADYTYEGLSAALIRSFPLIINATPVGTSPDVDICPDIPYEALTESHWLYDVVYNPANTLFLARGKQNGAHIKNGLDMLHLQAEQAWLIWKSYGRF